jgi:hypothetical protein
MIKIRAIFAVIVLYGTIQLMETIALINAGADVNYKNPLYASKIRKTFSYLRI